MPKGKQPDWDDTLLVGVARIDHEHKVFFDLILSLSEVDDNVDNHSHVLDLLRELELYAQFHFCSEENIMKSVQYPDYETHASEHRSLLGKLKTRIREFQTKSISLPAIVSFLWQWFSFHTTKVDMQLAQFIQEKHPEMTVDATRRP